MPLAEDGGLVSPYDRLIQQQHFQYEHLGIWPSRKRVKAAHHWSYENEKRLEDLCPLKTWRYHAEDEHEDEVDHDWFYRLSGACSDHVASVFVKPQVGREAIRRQPLSINEAHGILGRFHDENEREHQQQGPREGQAARRSPRGKERK